jgi:Matrixin
MAMMVFNTDFAFAKKGDSKSKKNIELCCTWGNSLDDGILTFSIENGGSDLAKIVKLSFNEWEKALDGEIKFKYIKDDSDADIEIEFKKGKGKKVGKTVTYFDYYGFIDQSDISISKKSYGVTLDKHTLEHVTKHEIGHALGLGHANFKNTLMSANVDEIIIEISPCEIDAVKYANSWKFSKNDDSSHPLDKDGYKCKKKNK